ncbi:MAG: S24/S26 family peptidase [Clostridia bacterium]|nr:S24/S26 family peptidase [Clostridia bacterium]
MNSNIDLKISMQQLIGILDGVSDTGAEICVTVNGTSMEPFLHHGQDKVFFSTLPEKLRRGDILLFKRPSGKHVMHRLYSIDEDGTFSFVGDAQVYPDKNIPRKNILYYVPKVIRNGKEINCNKGFWRFIMTLYMIVRVKHPKLTLKTAKLCRRIVRAIKNPLLALSKIRERIFNKN